MDQVVSVARTLDEALSPVWLNAALGKRYPGVHVTGTTLGPVDARTCTNARFRIDYEGELPPGLSPDLCVKGYFNSPNGPMPGAGEEEALFYRDLSEVLGVRTLRSVYADVDAETRNGVVITEDVVVGGAQFLNALSPYTPEQAAASLERYAELHRSTWMSPLVTGVPWLRSRLHAPLRARGLTEIRNNFEGPIGAGAPVEARDAERLLASLQALAVLAAESPDCVVHGDAHIGNLILDVDGAPRLVDWQLIQRGPWYLDVGYHIVSALSVEDRRRTERALLEHYLSCLGARDVPAPTWDEAWLGYRRGIVYGYFLWAITVLVKPEITSVLLERLGTAVADHDAFEAIES